VPGRHITLLCRVQYPPGGIPALHSPSLRASSQSQKGTSILYDLEGIREGLREAPEGVLRVKLLKTA